MIIPSYFTDDEQTTELKKWPRWRDMQHLPQTPATLAGLSGGQESLQSPLSLTSPSRQHMPPTGTLPKSHLPQTPAKRTGLSDGQLS